ncbi:hypothetical protein [Methylophilus sp. Leaf414]|uniref:hypothetical protein n=1 Tax=Methylophilus sp. Leaf414 TaxID=1736371 RepID=UPI0007006DC0|nr:hypothetical protein [Methylophilus sp. Leaf414]KQT34158.1 hypothetical protein ASG24_10440 [Methylophilus sp. Leaf414]
MFLASQIDLRKAFFDGEIFSLNKIELSAFMPWFICEVPEFEDDSEEAVCTTTHLIGDIDDLANFAVSHKIDKTYVISPGHLINQENWSLTRLKSISSATYQDEDYKSIVYRFETDTGQVIEHDISGLNKGKYELTFETILQFG